MKNILSEKENFTVEENDMTDICWENEKTFCINITSMKIWLDDFREVFALNIINKVF